MVWIYLSYNILFYFILLFSGVLGGGIMVAPMETNSGSYGCGQELSAITPPTTDGQEAVQRRKLPFGQVSACV